MLFKKHNFHTLVCSDISSHSDQALKAASYFTKTLNGRLTALHVVEQRPMWNWPPHSLANDHQTQIDVLHLYKEKLLQHLNSCEVKAEANVMFGLASSFIIQESTDLNVDLIVMGHKCATDSPIHLGSVAQRVISHANIPVLIVKRSLSLERIGVLVDCLSSMDDILPKAEELAGLQSSTLIAVSLFPDIGKRFLGKVNISDSFLNLTPTMEQDLIHEFEMKIVSYLKHPEKALLKVKISSDKRLAFHLNRILYSEHVQLAVMKRHQNDFFEKNLIGSETRRMLEIFDGNLLILPP